MPRKQPWLPFLILALGALGLTTAPTHAAFAAEGKAAGTTAISARGVVTRTDARPSPDPRRHVPDEVLLRLKPGLSPAAALRVLDTVPASSRRRLRLVDGLYHVKLAPGVSLHRALRVFGRSADVLYAEPNYVVEAFGTPSDPSFSSQWALQNTGQTGGTPGADIGATAAWDVTTGSGSVVVGVIDTGVDYTHGDLAANVFSNALDCNANGIDDDGNGYVDDCHGIDVVNDDSDPMDDEDHGSHVAGTIGAVGNNSLGVVGVNWSVGILPCKFLDAAGSGSTAGAITCMDYVAAMKDRGVNVVATNNSWGGGLFSQALFDAIQAHQQRGILFVAAAGNSGVDNDGIRTYPCSYYLPNVLCVAATDALDRRADFSNYGRTTVHIGAPGVAILSTTRANAYQGFDGTSMATPHVTGTVALLHAQIPGRDWREVKNLILSGGESRPSLATTTLSGKRLSARGALICTSAPLTARTRPAGSSLLSGIAAIELAVLNVNCGSPAGDVVVEVNPGGALVTLLDDGLGKDQVAGDGIYTAQWTPPSGGAFDLNYPDGSVVRVDVDPQLEPGFPVQAFQSDGSYQGGAAVHTLVGNIDGDSAREILVTALAGGPLYAWKANGDPVPGWPAVDIPGAAYPALGELSLATPGLEVFTAHYGAYPDLVARRGSALPLLGWPRHSANYVAAPATLADVDGDGIDEIFTEEEDWKLHAYRAHGAAVAGWPPSEPPTGGQERHTPAVADLDGDGVAEVITASGSSSGPLGGGIYLLAYHPDGTPVSGFPVFVSGGYADTFPVVGDVDGDGQPEIVVATQAGGPPHFEAGVRLYAANGTLKRSMTALGSVGYGTPPALADLDGDGVPEIVLQTDSAVNVWKGDGTRLAGWPVALGSGLWLKNGGPVVGDLDGDQRPDVAVLALQSADNAGDVVALRADGTPLPGFPKHLDGLGSGAVPAIADVDLDGRNELVVASDYWNGNSGYFDKVWVYDLGGPTPHGPAEWGQFMGGSRHQGRYLPVAAGESFPLSVARTGTGSGRVTSSPSGIDCGADCSEPYLAGTAVTLTAAPDPGSAFASWDGACSGQGNPCVVIMDAARSTSARFKPGVTLTVTLAGSGSGTVTSQPAGIACGSDCAEGYARGTVVTLTATPAAGSHFRRWTGACRGTAGTCTVTMSWSKSVAASFEP